MTQAILGTKAAWEKAQAANGGQRPSIDQVIAAFEGNTFQSPAGTVKMALGKGHQAITETAYGQTKLVKGQMTVTKVKRYPAEQVNPPEGVKSADWIASGFKKK
jgi:branched-chain amino acid transport system substrate-binding protein